MPKPCQDNQDNVTRMGEPLNGGLRRMEHVPQFRQGSRCDLSFFRFGLGGMPSGKTQSSAEAELYAAIMALIEAKGPESLGTPFGERPRMHAYVGAQATIGVSYRAGLGNAWYIQKAELWIQDALERREFELCKIAGDRNPAEAPTKPVPRETLDRQLRT